MLIKEILRNLAIVLSAALVTLFFLWGGKLVGDLIFYLSGSPISAIVAFVISVLCWLTVAVTIMEHNK